MPPRGRGKGGGGGRGKGKAVKRKQPEEPPQQQQNPDQAEEVDSEEEGNLPLNVYVASRGHQRKRTPTVAPPPPSPPSPQPSHTSSLAGSQDSDDLQDLDESDQEESSGKGKKHKKRSKAEPVRFDPDIEENLAQWYRHHEMFYVKRHNDYHNKAKKLTAMEEKAVALDLPLSDLKVWLRGMRTRAGRLLRPTGKSGEEAHDPLEEDLSLTPRDQWIKENFSFLSGHIARQKHRKITVGTKRTSKAASTVSGATTASAGTSDVPDRPFTPGHISEADSGGPSHQASRTVGLSVSQVPSVAPGSALSALTTTSEILNVAKSFQDALHGPGQTPSTPEEAAKRHMAEYMFHEACQMPTRRWTRFNMEIMQVILRFKQEQLDQELAQAPITTASAGPSTYYFPQQQQQPDYFARPYHQTSAQYYHPQQFYPPATATATAAAAVRATPPSASGMTYHTLQPVRRPPVQPSAAVAPPAAVDTVSPVPAQSWAPSSRPPSRASSGPSEVSPIPVQHVVTTSTTSASSFEPGALFARSRQGNNTSTPLGTPAGPSANDSFSSSGRRTPSLAAVPTPGTVDLLSQAAAVTGVDSPGFLSQFANTPSADLPTTDADGSFYSQMLGPRPEDDEDD